MFLCLGAACSADVESVGCYNKIVNGITANVVEINMVDQRIIVTPVVATGFPNAPESFSRIIKRSKPIAAINGTFFCTVSYVPVGDIVINRQLVNFAGLGTALAITANNRVEFIKVKRWRHMDWSKYMTVIASGPRLLDNGAMVFDPKSEGFKDPRLFAIRNRSAVGVTKDKMMLFVTVKAGVSLNHLARIMKSLGCIDAMNLDGGGSSGLYYDGKIVTKPDYMLTNIIAVYQVESSLKKSIAESMDKKIKLFSLTLEKEGNVVSVKGLKDSQTFAELNVGKFPFFNDTTLKLFSYFTLETGPKEAVIKTGKKDRVFAIMRSEGNSVTVIFPVSKGEIKK